MCQRVMKVKQITWYCGVILSGNTFSRLIQMPSKKEEVISVFIFNGKAVEVEKMSYIYCLFYNYDISPVYITALYLLGQDLKGGWGCIL